MCLSATLGVTCEWYRRYFWQKVSVLISAILFESIVNNPARWQDQSGIDGILVDV